MQALHFDVGADILMLGRELSGLRAMRPGRCICPHRQYLTIMFCDVQRLGAAAQPPWTLTRLTLTTLHPKAMLTETLRGQL